MLMDKERGKLKVVFWDFVELNLILQQRWTLTGN